MKLFDAFKQYVVKHPRVAAYKPTSDKYDRNELFAILRKLGPDDMKVPKEEVDKVGDFLWITDMAHSLYKDFYCAVEERLGDLCMKGDEIVEYFIAFLNHDYKSAKGTEGQVPVSDRI